MLRTQTWAGRILGLLLAVAIVMSAGGLVLDARAAELRARATVAYLDRGNNLWVSEDNGANARQVTTSGGFVDIVWSSDGSRIAVTGPYGDGGGVYLASPDAGFGFRGLTRGGSPVWSLNSARLAMLDSGRVHIFDREGTYARSVDLGADTLRWSPDNRRIGFTRVIADPYGTGCETREIGWIDADTGQNAIVARSYGKFTWAADGNRLLYVSASDGAIRSYDIAAGTSRTLTSKRANPCGGPFFTDSEGKRLFFLDQAGSGRDLVAVNINGDGERVYADLPIGYPSDRLPESYVTVDIEGRFAYAVETFPTTVTRIDLGTGARTALLVNDHRMFLGFSRDHSRIALIYTPYGKPSVTSVRDIATGDEADFENVGWLSWQASEVTPSSVLAWDRVWDREDRAVAVHAAQRTWIWGPEPFATRHETYDDSPGGERAVRYYDKSRMEINIPFGDQQNRWYVTNGLLARELIRGQMQVGDDRFVDRGSAEIPVAGDLNDANAPTYNSLRGVLDAPAGAVGSEIRASINRNGLTDTQGPGGVHAAYFVGESGHTVANVFWDYLNSRSLVWDGSAFVTASLFDPTFFATGFPITEAYWTRVRVAGEEKDVLLQCFERRCLTYTPSNPDGWQVEMGNVGRHYYAWRYSGF